MPDEAFQKRNPSVLSSPIDYHSMEASCKHPITFIPLKIRFLKTSIGWANWRGICGGAGISRHDNCSSRSTRPCGFSRTTIRSSY
ncbi:hypothetical protein NSPZN2_10004 [Nitrospira defluvii]|uniref:Uncharacterized protein n=1 Tax=Nitrospira defluvii TaxID=330214 RepID=A0ABM8QAW4_9BACT|nr:hypothetical protein NSPZN2_10004 [Nitrospira defluvii]